MRKRSLTNTVLFIVLLVGMIHGLLNVHAAETGLVAEIDHIGSAPRAFFGRAGGPFVVTLNAEPSGEKKAYLIDGDERFAIERFAEDGAVRLWSYWHSSCCEGRVTSYLFRDDEMLIESMTINPGDGGTAVGRSIYRSIFDPENVLEMQRISPYTAPPDPSGKPWGEG